MPTANDVALQQIDPKKILPNEDNPRLIFREAEMETLLDSINSVGIKVPLSVYRDRKRFVLIDGERRWRCALKLNLREVPTFVQPKPERLENILTMFNIHNVRQDWDLMPTAFKLRDVQNLINAQEGTYPSAKTLSSLTGLTLSAVRRCLDLLELPVKYQRQLMREAEKPKEQQVIKVDLFVEINKAKNAIRRHTPTVFSNIREDDFVEAMVSKYTRGRVPSVTSFRDISKMARAQNAGGDPRDVVPALIRLVTTPNMTIQEAYADTVREAYTSRELISRASSLADRLKEVRRKSELSPELVRELRTLRDELNRLLD